MCIIVNFEYNARLHCRHIQQLDCFSTKTHRWNMIQHSASGRHSFLVNPIHTDAWLFHCTWSNVHKSKRTNEYTREIEKESARKSIVQYICMCEKEKSRLNFNIHLMLVLVYLSCFRHIAPMFTCNDAYEPKWPWICYCCYCYCCLCRRRRRRRCCCCCF